MLYLLQDRRDMGPHVTAALDHQLMNGGGTVGAMAGFSSKLRHPPDFQPPYFPPPYCPLPPPHSQQHQSPADFLTGPASADPYAYLANHNPYMAAAHPYVTGQPPDARILLNVAGAGGFHSQYDNARRAAAADPYRSSHDVIMVSRGHHDTSSLVNIHQLNADDSQMVSDIEYL